MVCLVFFAFTTILGWDYYSERCLEYLSEETRSWCLASGGCISCAFYRAIHDHFRSLTIADIFNGLMALPNLVALFALNGVIVAETKKNILTGRRSPRFKNKRIKVWILPYLYLFVFIYKNNTVSYPFANN